MHLTVIAIFLVVNLIFFGCKNRTESKVQTNETKILTYRLSLEKGETTFCNTQVTLRMDLNSMALVLANNNGEELCKDFRIELASILTEMTPDISGLKTEKFYMGLEDSAAGAKGVLPPKSMALRFYAAKYKGSSSKRFESPPVVIPMSLIPIIKDHSALKDKIETKKVIITKNNKLLGDSSVTMKISNPGFSFPLPSGKEFSHSIMWQRKVELSAPTGEVQNTPPYFENKDLTVIYSSRPMAFLRLALTSDFGEQITPVTDVAKNSAMDDFELTLELMDFPED